MDKLSAPELSDRILVWCYSETEACTLENCDWYRPDSFPHLHFSVAQFIRAQLDSFYGAFSEYFNLAEFPDVLEQLEPSELPVFLKAAGAPNDADRSSIEDYDCFSGLCAVIRHRLDHRSLEQIQQAAELFNWTIGPSTSGCSPVTRYAHAVLRVGLVGDVAPFLVERILNRFPNDAKGDLAYEDRLSGFEHRFLPLLPVLRMLKETVESTDWVKNHLALRIFFWIAEMYKLELENNTG